MSASGPIHRFLADDHSRLDALLEGAFETGVLVDPAAYATFRAGLLRHIGMEEKILIPAIQRLRGGEAHEHASRLRLDHGAIAALLVPTPSRDVVSMLRTILTEHNQLEESSGGLYDTCDQIAGTETASIVDLLRAAPEVPVAPHNDGPLVMDAIRRALARAGYDFGG
jgi:hypothetical protein